MHRAIRFAASTILVLALPVFAAAAAATGPSTPAQVTLEDSLGYGYTRDTGQLAIDPLLVYAICVESETLVVAADHVDDVRTRLQATVAGDGTWVLPTGESLHPQIGTLQIASTATQAESAAVAATTVSVANVILATFATSCTKTIKGHRCIERNCDGCVKLPNGAGIKESGGKVTMCVRSTKATDECTLTGAFLTCTLTEYENEDCTGQILSTGIANHKSCQR